MKTTWNSNWRHRCHRRSFWVKNLGINDNYQLFEVRNAIEAIFLRPQKRGLRGNSTIRVLLTMSLKKSTWSESPPFNIPLRWSWHILLQFSFWTCSRPLSTLGRRFPWCVCFYRLCDGRPLAAGGERNELYLGWGGMVVCRGFQSGMCVMVCRSSRGSETSGKVPLAGQWWM